MAAANATGSGLTHGAHAAGHAIGRGAQHAGNAINNALNGNNGNR